MKELGMNRCRIGRCFAVLLLSLIVLPGCLDAASASTPTELVDQFFTTEVHSLSGGLPSADDLRHLQPLFSDRLHGLLAAALDYRTDWIARHPDEPHPAGGPPIIHKPPFVDGDFFTGSPDAVSVAVARTVQLGDSQWVVYLRLRIEPGTMGWENGVLILRERGRYVIDDIFFRTSESERCGSLSAYLAYRGDR